MAWIIGCSPLGAKAIKTIAIHAYLSSARGHFSQISAAADSVYSSGISRGGVS
jgi:hypothetical protein